MPLKAPRIYVSEPWTLLTNYMEVLNITKEQLSIMPVQEHNSVQAAGLYSNTQSMPIQQSLT